MEFFGTTVGRLVVLAAATALVVGVFWIMRATRSGPRRSIRVVGVGGAGANAIDAMERAGMRDVDYVAVNTDVAALNRSSARTKIVIGRSTTAGLGAGGDVGMGESSAREAAEAIGRAIDGSDLVVIVAGLGGGTGSGAAPVVAEIAGGKGMLTLAVVTKPFAFEGSRKARAAQDAEAALAGLVDAVATIPNDEVRTTAPADVTVEDAFHEIDQAVHRNVAEIVEMVAVPGRINLDFADARAVLRGGGAAAMGSGRAAGETRAADAARSAIAATRLDDGIRGARSVLVNVSGSRKLRLAELDAVAETVLAATGRDTNLIFGVGVRPKLQDDLQVTIVATRGGVATSTPVAEATPQPATTPEGTKPPEPAAAKGTTPELATANATPPEAATAKAAPPEAATAKATPPPPPKPQRAADIAATIASTSDVDTANVFESDSEPEESDEWKPVWLRKRAAPPTTPAPDAGTNRSQAAGTSRRERRKRGRTDRSTRPDEGV
jgi:cell division protein FtsZ